MDFLEEIKNKLMRELEEVSRRGTMSTGDLEFVHKLTDTIKNIDKICMLEGDDDGYSRDSYDDGNSYRRHYVKGHYSRGGDWVQRRRRNGYSRDDGKQEYLEKLRQMEGETDNDRIRDAIRRAMEQIEG